MFLILRLPWGGRVFLNLSSYIPYIPRGGDWSSVCLTIVSPRKLHKKTLTILVNGSARFNPQISFIILHPDFRMFMMHANFQEYFDHHRSSSVTISMYRSLQNQSLIILQSGQHYAISKMWESNCQIIAARNIYGHFF